ncbi:MAG: hypothetical protein LLG01_04285 [Planctomycetaceae bacterium]|nr:hypothetical protein [Planctomycetaceae bacterium]
MADKDTTGILRRIRRGFFAGVGFLVMGYAACYTVPHQLHMASAVVAMATLFAGMSARNVGQGVFRGAALGALAGIGLFAGWYNFNYQLIDAPRPPQVVASGPATLPEGAVIPLAADPHATSWPTSQQARAIVEQRKGRMALMLIGGTGFMGAIIAGAFAFMTLRRRAAGSRH